MSLEDKIRSHILEIPNFPKKNIFFKDIQPLLRNGALFKQCCKELLSSSHKTPDVWMGVESRGFFLASALSILSETGFGLIRKKGKLPPPTLEKTYDLEYGTSTLEINPTPKKKSVILLDDVLATGGTLKACEALCQEAGYEVLGAMVIIDLSFLHP